MSRLQFLERHRTTIDSLAIPQAHPPEFIFDYHELMTPLTWDNACKEIDSLFEKRSYAAAVKMAASLATLFPDRKSRIPFTTEQLKTSIRFISDTFMGNIDRTVARFYFLESISLARALCDGLEMLEWPMIENALTIVSNSVSEMLELGKTLVAHDYAYHLCLTDGTMCDMTGAGPNPHLKSLKELQQKQWWLNHEMTAEFLHSLEVVRLLSGQEGRAFRIPKHLEPYITHFLITVLTTDMAEGVHRILQVAIATADHTEVRKDGLYLAPVLSLKDYNWEEQPPLQRSF